MKIQKTEISKATANKVFDSFFGAIAKQTKKDEMDEWRSLGLGFLRSQKEKQEKAGILRLVKR